MNSPIKCPNYFCFQLSCTEYIFFIQEIARKCPVLQVMSRC